MSKKVLTALVIVGSLALGACSEDPTMDELIQDTELNSQQLDPGDDDKDSPTGGN